MYFVKDVNTNVNPTELLQNLITLYFDRDYDTIYQILKLEKNENHPNNIPSDKYYSKEMVFCKDENPLIQVRIHVDEETRYILNTLLMVSSNLIDEKELINLIIYRWIKSVGVIGLLKYDNIPKIVGKETYSQLKVGKESWNTLTMACKNKGISLKKGIKIAILNFINYKIIPTKPLLDENDLKYNNQNHIYKSEKIEVLKDDKYVITNRINIDALTLYIENKVNRSYSSNDICDLNECWEWNKNVRHEYGILNFNNNKGIAHRVSYIIKNGYIPKDMIICHKCDNPPCINPNHLFVGTYSDNAKDSVNKGRHKYMEKCKNSIFTEEQIREIRTMFNNGITKTEIAKKIGCNKQQLNTAFYYKFKK